MSSERAPLDYNSAEYEMYRVPSTLAVRPFALSRVLIVGSCYGESLGPHLATIAPGSTCDMILYNNPNPLPALPKETAASYDCQVVLLPLRAIMHDSMTMRLRADDLEGYKAAFAQSRQRLVMLLDGALQYNRENQIPAFVGNFMLPQQNGLGRLMPRRDLRNPVFYIEELNRIIAEHVDPLPNAYLLDLDAISANFGRRHIQDDASWMYAHNTVMDDFDFHRDQHRLELPIQASVMDDTRPRLFSRALWHEVTAMVRTIRQVDQVKAVIVDLDDTLWRGVVAEEGLANPALTEGWPIALVEALLYLKNRGVLLAIVSKNSAEVIEQAWDEIFAGRLLLTDFAVRKINWESKAENVAAVIRQFNILPSSVVFIDDNPVERAAVQDRFPDVRVLGSNPMLIRRILLWAPETQVAALTTESLARTEMVQAGLARDEGRETLSREDFLASLHLTVDGRRIMQVEDEQFPRALELLNKSNQFNTTGQRWTREMAATRFAAGGWWQVFHVADRFSRYGLVGVAVCEATTIAQFVMSCRVVGLEAEIAMLAQVTAGMGAPSAVIHGALTETPANLLARDLFPRCGFTPSAGGFVLTRKAVRLPPHVNAGSAEPMPDAAPADPVPPKAKESWRAKIEALVRVNQRAG